MSHFTRIQTQMVDRAYLVHALEDLGLAFEEGAQAVRGYGGQRTNVELRVPTRSPGYDIGFRKAPRAGGEAAYEIVADWWGIRDVNRDSLVQRLTQRYAYHAARDQLEAQGFTLVSEERQADGQVHLLLRRTG